MHMYVIGNGLSHDVNSIKVKGQGHLERSKVILENVVFIKISYESFPVKHTCHKPNVSIVDFPYLGALTNILIPN